MAGVLLIHGMDDEKNNLHISGELQLTRCRLSTLFGIENLTALAPIICFRKQPP
jgi:hypothetical protein